MLTDTKLRSLKPKEKAYKVSDRDGLYVFISTKGTKSFRFDYRIHGRRETVTFGQFGDGALSLKDAREQLTQAKKLLQQGVSPSSLKRQRKLETINAYRFSFFAEQYLYNTSFAESTREVKKSTYTKEIKPLFANKLMTEISTNEIRLLCDKILERGSPSTAVRVRDFFNATYKYAISKGYDFINPASKIANASIATFKARNRALSPQEIHLFFTELQQSDRSFVLQQALLLTLLTLSRKGELLGAKWEELNDDYTEWHIPAERMKNRKAHVVYLPKQASEIFKILKIYARGSCYIFPSRVSLQQHMHKNSLNKIVLQGVQRINEKYGNSFKGFTVHDLRRTASTLLHEYGFNTDWIEKALSHEQGGVRAVYNKAEYKEGRQTMLQWWADHVEKWINGDFS